MAAFLSACVVVFDEGQGDDGGGQGLAAHEQAKVDD